MSISSTQLPWALIRRVSCGLPLRQALLLCPTEADREGKSMVKGIFMATEPPALRFLYSRRDSGLYLVYIYIIHVYMECFSLKGFWCFGILESKAAEMMPKSDRLDCERCKV